MLDRRSKALRAAVRRVWSAQVPVQRCRAHKLRNVVERLPKAERDQAKAAESGAAWRLGAQRCDINVRAAWRS